MGVFTEVVVPIFGNILATAMLLSPFPAVLRTRHTGKLGDVNPLPYPMTCINAVGWVAYGFTIANPYVLPANVLGFLSGIFFTMTAFAYAARKLQDIITAMLVTATGYFIMLGCIGCFALNPSQAARMWGTSGVAILMVYYVVPLSTMVTIVRTRNAASIYPPLAATAIANGAMWTIYGFAVQDINLWLPNMFGTLIGTLQLVLRLLYGARPSGDAASSGVVVGTRRDEEAAFAAVYESSEAPAVQERQESSSKLLNPGFPGSSGWKAAEGRGGGEEQAVNGDSGKAADHGAGSGVPPPLAVSGQPETSNSGTAPKP